MAKRRSIAEARGSLPSLIRDAESGESIELTRRGEPVAVLIGRRQYERLAGSTRGFAAAYGAFIRDNDLDELAVDPDELFSGLRDRTRGREVRL